MTFSFSSPEKTNCNAFERITRQILCHISFLAPSSQTSIWIKLQGADSCNDSDDRM